MKTKRGGRTPEILKKSGPMKDRTKKIGRTAKYKHPCDGCKCAPWERDICERW